MFLVQTELLSSSAGEERATTTEDERARLNTSGSELLKELNLTRIRNSIRFKKKLWWPHAKLMQVG